ncbi:hypothetical protein [Acuticoccus sediminis]|uniref:hypothetical protein n=1 Tax=Acuticoccus sediminis TaxID=2184697 RepID=UPI001CFD1257|nr:hypothetical protein [Acuticoccus sediminis]
MSDTSHVLALIESHTRLLGDQPVLIATTEETETRYGDTLYRRYAGKERSHYAEFHEVEPCLEVLPYQAVLVLAGSHQDFVRFCRTAVPRHAADRPILPVLLRGPETGVADWQMAGVTENGLYHLLGQYVQTLPQGTYCEVGAGYGRSLTVAAQAMGSQRLYAIVDPHGPEGSECTGPDCPLMSEAVISHHLRGADLSARLRTVRIEGGAADVSALRSITVVAFNDVTGRGVLTALRALRSGFAEGTVLMLRRYFSASSVYGMRAPLMTWLAETPDLAVETYREYGPYGKAFVVRRAGPGAAGLPD